MSSFFRRTLGFSWDSPDVESSDVNQDDLTQEYSTTPLPNHVAPSHSSPPVHAHQPTANVHYYPAPHPSSSQVHSNPVAVPLSAPHSYTSHTPPLMASAEHPIYPTMAQYSSEAHEPPAVPQFQLPDQDQSAGPAHEQSLRREHAAVPKHRLQRQTKALRPIPFYDEPVSTYSMSL